MSRLFIGIPLLVPALGSALHDLLAVAPNARVVPEAKRHLTLRFLGDCDPTPAIDAMRRAAHASGPLAGEVRGVGAFPDPLRARVAWAGVQARGLLGFVQRLRAETQGLGQPEGRLFAAHLTLARLDAPTDMRPWCIRHATTSWGPFGATEVTLFDSVPGAVAYEALHTVRLGSLPA